MDREEKHKKELIQRLDVLISILLEAPRPDKPVSITEKISRLTDLGLAPAETARIIGKPVNYVTSVLSGRKRRVKGA